MLGSICFRLKNALCFFVCLKTKRGLQKTYFFPLISVFTLVNSELRNFSSDKVISKLLIVNDLRCHLSLVTFAFTLSFDVLCLFFVHGFIGFMTSIRDMVKWVTPLGRVFKIHNIFLHYFSAWFCRILMSISSMVKWVTPLGVR